MRILLGCLHVAMWGCLAGAAYMPACTSETELLTSLGRLRFAVQANRQPTFIACADMLPCVPGQSLLSLVQNTTHDSFELYYGLFLYNPVRCARRIAYGSPSSWHTACRLFRCAHSVEAAGCGWEGCSLMICGRYCDVAQPRVCASLSFVHVLLRCTAQRSCLLRKCINKSCDIMPASDSLGAECDRGAGAPGARI